SALLYHRNWRRSVLRAIWFKMRHLPYMAGLHAQVFRRTGRYLKERAGAGMGGVRILDVGCGTLYPLTVLFHSIGAHVVGVDLAPLRRKDVSISALSHVMLTRGVARGAVRYSKDIATRILYYRHLAPGRRLSHRDLRLVTSDVGRLSFADESFDVAISFATV